MKNKNSKIKLPLRFELAYEIIYKATCFIFFGLAFLFASNLLRFNGYTAFFGSLTFLLIYLRRSSYLVIQNNQLQLVYFKFFKEETLNLNEVRECVFYENRALIEIKNKNHKRITIYLNKKNKERLLNWMVVHHPEVPSLYIKNT